MKTKLPILVAAILAGLLTACVTPQTRSQASKVVDVRKWVAAQEKPVRFVSHGGRLYLLDNDDVITLAKGGKVEIIRYGDAKETFRGTYSVDPNGVIALTMPGQAKAWPDMDLTINAEGPLLLPVDAKLAAGMKESRGYWAFRPERK
jgi:hypothetical protein